MTNERLVRNAALPPKRHYSVETRRTYRFLPSDEELIALLDAFEDDRHAVADLLGVNFKSLCDRSRQLPGQRRWARKRSVRPLPDRFWEKVDRSGECWTWTGALAYGGYGEFAVGGRPARAHRVAFELVNGPIPPGLSVLHRCDNRPCVNPAHLYAGTQRDNMRDASERHRLVRPQRTTCRQGHPLDVANLYVGPSGERGCRICRNRTVLAYQRRRRERVGRTS